MDTPEINHQGRDQTAHADLPRDVDQLTNINSYQVTKLKQYRTLLPNHKHQPTNQPQKNQQANQKNQLHTRPTNQQQTATN
jgi:hypothetical protein